MYKLQEKFNIDGTIKLNPTSVIRIADGAVIPFDPDNTDYQAYLKWVEEGGVPLPADEVTQ